MSGARFEVSGSESEYNSLGISIIEGIIDRESAYRVTSEGFVLPDCDALRIDVDDHIDDAELRLSALDDGQNLAGYALYKTFNFDGRTDYTITKVDDENFILDFSKPEVLLA